MNTPYIFGHRGGMGDCIENTIPCFKKAVELGVGIETDVQLTRDNKLVCFHDPYIKIQSKWNNVKDLSLNELKSIKFKDNREIPAVEELFATLSNINKEVRYSFDIRGEEAGQKLIDLAIHYHLLNYIEITERNLSIIKALRDYNKDVKLVLTLSESIRKVNNENVDFLKLRDLGVKAINLKDQRINFNNFKIILDNDLDCYVWDINRELQMIKVLKLKYRDQNIAAIYTDYPKLLKIYRDKIVS